jgi:hypothetical protein
MNFDGVDPFEMEPRDHRDIDDHAANELLSGRGHDVDPALADVLGDVRVAFGSVVPAAGLELEAVMTARDPKPTHARRTPRMRSRFVTRMAAVASFALVATGSLAGAGALPGPAQDTAERVAAAVGLGISAERSDAPHGRSDEHRGGPNVSSTTTSVTDGTDATTPSTGPKDNHGAEVSAVAKDDSTVGCEHGRAVSAVASGTSNDKPCPDTSTTTTTISVPLGAPTSVPVPAGPPAGLPVRPSVPDAPPGKPADPGSGPPAGTPGATHPTPDVRPTTAR